ncbi:MAG: efflux RND transporter periplasmic adaptor subunit [Synergistaceae bacterium]|jgi:HlyD family secretion protein|nr:efflux RND transporter periplasmic adaptor subunit [Synergistaceae bacterium]
MKTLPASKRIILVLSLAAAAVIAVLRFGGADPASDFLTLYGNVDIRQVSMAFSDAERITEMTAEEGDRVKSGDVLARLDTGVLDLQIEGTAARIESLEQALLRMTNGARPEEISQASARVESARAEADFAAGRLKRMEDVFKSSSGRSVSGLDMDDARAADRVARARLAEAQKALELVRAGPREEDIAQARAELRASRSELALQRHRRSMSELRAPIESVVRSRLMEPGEMASPQHPVYLLAVNDPKWVRAYIQETHLGWIRPGLDVEVFTDSHPDTAIQGRVGYVSSVAEFTPRTVQTEELRTSLLYEIRVRVRDPDDLLRLGMPASVRIKRPGPDEL